MQLHRMCAVVGIPLFSLLSAGSVLAQGAQQPQVQVETLYPRYAARGQTTVVNVAMPRGLAVQAAEISPATGVTVSHVTGNAGGSEQAIGWWEITVDVAKDAAPGDRSLVLVLPMGRSAPTTITVPTHVPTISDLKVVPSQSNQPAIELRLTAADAAGDLGAGPYLWFTADCGGESLVGAIRGSVDAGVVRATLPDLRAAAAGAGIQATGSCDLRVRITDAVGIDSNTLKTTVALKN